MVLRRHSRPSRRLRRLLVLGGAVTGIGTLRTLLLARNERRYSHVIAKPSGR